jgi:hypothetical protein
LGQLLVPLRLRRELHHGREKLALHDGARHVFLRLQLIVLLIQNVVVAKMQLMPWLLYLLHLRSMLGFNTIYVSTEFFCALYVMLLKFLHIEIGLLIRHTLQIFPFTMIEMRL